MSVQQYLLGQRSRRVSYSAGFVLGLARMSGPSYPFDRCPGVLREPFSALIAADIGPNEVMGNGLQEPLSFYALL